MRKRRAPERSRTCAVEGASEEYESGSRVYISSSRDRTHVHVYAWLDILWWQQRAKSELKHET